MKFANLPVSCPPASHDTGSVDDVWRVLDQATPVPRDWLSHTERKIPCPTPKKACTWASLSLTRNPLAQMALKNLAHCTHAARLSIPANAGAHVSRGNHVDFWAANGTVPSALVAEVKKFK